MRTAGTDSSAADGPWGRVTTRAIDQMRAHPIGVALNEAPKYVGSTTLTAPRSEDTTVLRGDLAAAISELTSHRTTLS